MDRFLEKFLNSGLIPQKCSTHNMSFLVNLNVVPADKYYGRDHVIRKNWEKVRQEPMKMRRELKRMAIPESLPNGMS